MIYFLVSECLKMLISTAILDWCITSRRLDGTAVRLEKALDLLSRDKTEIEKATGILGSRLFCKRLWMLLPEVESNELHLLALL